MHFFNELRMSACIIVQRLQSVKNKLLFNYLFTINEFIFPLQMALKHHPDKNPNNPEATEKVS